MRISDWSSDVCSSDLLGAGVAVGTDERRARQDDGLFGRYHMAAALPFVAQVEQGDTRRSRRRARFGDEGGAGRHQRTVRPEIGRAHVRTTVTNAHIV